MDISVGVKGTVGCARGDGLTYIEVLHLKLVRNAEIEGS